MPFDPFHDLPGEVSQETRALAHLITSLIEQADETTAQTAPAEELTHFDLGLEFLLSHDAACRSALEGIFFEEARFQPEGEEP